MYLFCDDNGSRLVPLLHSTQVHNESSDRRKHDVKDENAHM